MRRFVFFLLFPLALACSGEGFTEFYEIDRLRVLAVGATKPWLQFSETATISALVVNDRANTQPISYEWSWCPLPQGADQAYECSFTQEELQAQIDAQTGPGVVTVPSFDLGTTESVTYAYDLPPLFFEGVCDGIRMLDEVPEFVSLPECDGTFPITIRLRVSTPDGEDLIAVKEIFMVYDTDITEVNVNPQINGVSAANPLTPEMMMTLSASAATDLARTTAWQLELDVDESQAETYVEDGETRTENLVASWFIDKDSGELDRTRSSFFDGEIPFDNLVMNEWETAKLVDFEEDTARLFIVLRDERRGVSWITRQVNLR